MMKFQHLLIAIGIYIFFPIAVAESREQLHYGTEASIFIGTATFEDHFGPPNFGETPKIDEKINAPFLILDAPIDVIVDQKQASHPDATNVTSFFGVTKIHLVLSGNAAWDVMRSAVGKKQKIVVEGTLFQAHTAYHFSEVLIGVKSIKLLNP